MRKNCNTKKLLRVILRNNLHRYLSVCKRKVSGWVESRGLWGYFKINISIGTPESMTSFKSIQITGRPN